jgi:cytochrome c biogenesis protein CcmG/thiol:disulfide interchange protein DsbE
MSVRRRALALALVLCALLGTACGGASTTRAGVGQRAPTFSTFDLNGRAVRLTSFRGSTVVVNFWASWCIPCRHEFPLLAQLDAEPNVVVLGVVYNDSEANARAFMAAHGGTWPGLKDDGRIARAYRVGPGIPATIVVSPKGVITQRHIGELQTISGLV